MVNDNELKKIMQRGSLTFSFAARFFPRKTRQDIQKLYYFFRSCDDVFDEQQGGLNELLKMQESLDQLYRGEALSDSVFIVLASLVETIPQKNFLDFLTGMKLDIIHQPYKTCEELLYYCYCVAGVVGVVLARVMGVSDPQALVYASHLGIAMQLTNIARDVIEDQRIGRCYLPLNLLQAQGLGHDYENSYFDSKNRQELFFVVSQLLQLAHVYYESGSKGFAFLPFRCRFVVMVAKMLYERIGHKILKQKERYFNYRVKTSFFEKIFLVWRVSCQITHKIVLRDHL